MRWPGRLPGAEELSCGGAVVVVAVLMACWSNHPGHKCLLTRASESRHVVVTCNDHFYKVPVLDEQFEPLAEEVVLSHLQHVHEHALARPRGTAVGLLTADNRDRWAQNRNLLQEVRTAWRRRAGARWAAWLDARLL